MDILLLEYRPGILEAKYPIRVSYQLMGFCLYNLKCCDWFCFCSIPEIKDFTDTFFLCLILIIYISAWETAGIQNYCHNVSLNKDINQT